MNSRKNEFKNSFELKQQSKKPSKAITSIDRYQVITKTLDTINTILKDLKKDNPLKTKHRMTTLKRELAIEIRKEIPSFQPKQKVLGLSNIIPSKPTTSSTTPITTSTTTSSTTPTTTSTTTPTATTGST
jgi:hypothetical protein